MTIGLISDTHGYLGEDVARHLEDCDEIWHAGDIGDLSTARQLEAFQKPLRIVWGNIDDSELRLIYPKDLIFYCNEVKVFITHIGGYPGRYTKHSFKTIMIERPDIFICGHSHILKVMKDSKYNLLHMNPGACGNKGFHIFRTLLKFDLTDGSVKNLRAIELGKRGALYQ